MHSAHIFLYGTFTPQAYEYCWLQWLREHGYRVTTLERECSVQSRFPYPLSASLWKVCPEILAWYESRTLVNRVRAATPDLLLVVSGRLVTRAALDEIAECSAATVRFHFYNEDYFNRLNTPRIMLTAANGYDHLFTTKSFNVPELSRLGITKVTYVPHGYRPNCHYPVTISPEDRKRYGADVAFAGTWEQPRAAALELLHEFDLKIWGNCWEHVGPPLASSVQKRAVYCEEASKVVNTSKINLAFLRKANRDLHTSRTFEIPACGGFQLSERTGEILEFFSEGREIECFGTVEEMKDKSVYYLAHEPQRVQIAAAGLERVRRSKYSFTDRLETVMQRFHETRPR